MLATAVAVSSLPALAQSKDAELATRQANAAVLGMLPFSDRQDFEDARRGFIATLPDGLIAGSGATPVWNMKSYEFLNREEAPATVNPSLWRQARLNAIHGLAQNLGNPSWDSNVRFGPLAFPVHPHMRRHACGYALANAG